MLASLSFDMNSMWPIFIIGLLSSLVLRWWSREASRFKVQILFYDLLLSVMVGTILVFLKVFIVSSISINLPANPNTNIWAVFGILVAILTFMVGRALNLSREAALELKSVKRASKGYLSQQKKMEEWHKLTTQRLNLSTINTSELMEATILKKQDRIDALDQIKGLFLVCNRQDVLKKLLPIEQEEHVRNALSSEDWAYLIKLRDYYRDFPDEDAKEVKHRLKNAIEKLLVHQNNA